MINNVSKAFGTLLLAATIAVPLVHLFHPETSGESLDDVVRSLAEHANADRIVHGTVALLVLAMFLPYVQLAHDVGFDLAAVRSAIAIGALATVALFGIPLVDGVILPSVAERYAEPDAATQIEGFRSILRLAAIGVLPALTMAAAVGFSAGTLCWCVGFRETVGGRRVLPALGLILSMACLAGVILTRSPMALELCLVAWNRGRCLLVVRQARASKRLKEQVLSSHGQSTGAVPSAPIAKASVAAEARVAE